ncbi:multicopper oxidase family protein [Sphaerisporangium fuscum]|uniref:multicopper oxidase family protein n=1 Tax=Sphaerisporangium fuscum TaxID=2835868 RepID=UPI001BDD3B7A|nr:multicopper oxidase family protein [Sphaerisporangium fuscum]
MLNRRRLLALGATVGGALVLPFTKLTPVGAKEGEPLHKGYHIGRRTAGTGVRPAVAAFTEQMPVPPVLQPAQSATGVDVYKIAIQNSTAEILPGLKTPVLSYGGSFVGPTIRAKTGRPVKIMYVNQLGEPANVHLHGGHVPAVSDGHPMDVIQPGQARVYDYPNNQQGATLWYHDHSHHTEAEHVYRGLHGFYIIEDAAEKMLALPTGQYDVPIMLRDSEFDKDGGLIFFDDPANRTTILANGKIQPYFPVAARKYRFRLLNASNEHVFKLNLGGREMVQIASDGGLLPAPAPLTELVLASAERAEIVVDFARYPIGTQLVLSNGADPVLRFDVVRPALDLSRLPSTLRPLPAFTTAAVERDVAMSFDLTGTDPIGLVNGRPYDPNRIDFQIKQGTTEIWNVSNADTIGIDHTFHMHMTHFQVLERNGGKPLPQDAGLKDTVHVPPDGKVRIQATFADYTGKYVYHCHYLEHSSIGMMGQMEIVT